ncbi:MAG: hypothetical protein HN345_10840, partial [Planctomycetaceae bacterium]|nr:hypothetical protein [Planctomycetaceae bacterium]
MLTHKHLLISVSTCSFMYHYFRKKLQRITVLLSCGFLFFIALGGMYSFEIFAALPDRGSGITDEVEEEFRQRNGRIFTGWSTPQAVLVITGEL